MIYLGVFGKGKLPTPKNYLRAIAPKYYFRHATGNVYIMKYKHIENNLCIN